MREFRDRSPLTHLEDSSAANEGLTISVSTCYTSPRRATREMSRGYLFGGFLSGSLAVSTATLLIVAFSLYFALNLACALALHRHADRQAHLPVRSLDVLVHFLLLTAFAIPVLLVVLMEALFGGDESAKAPKVPKVSHLGAPAA